ncbi:hypothetical protein BJ875DRAFT_493601 [Amylocarpus encephaloides]|uniref:Uncharacterized protein n=1 Tax=Amylocarpus encephaloides TaxID=45428 RepID=A0A9P7YNW3_9HELO|nr:hypothetical protein BJ875DRAFT_493601 [Amylocarpus encephaloides]
MAPDLNSVPPSPRPLAASPRLTSRNTSRRASQQIAPPPLPPNSLSLNILPSNQSAVNNALSPPLSSPGMVATTSSTGHTVGDNTGVGAGPGPLRHPRPLTAADLHLQLEKEQEAVVNRLTRELSMLRAAQNASVVSNTSSTSAGLPDSADHNANHLLSGPSHPAPSQRRHHRTSSSTSTRSIASNTAGIAGLVPSSTADRTRGTVPRHDSIPQSQSLSRQNSTTGRSGASSPAPFSSAQSSYQHADSFPHFYQQRPSLSQYREPSSGNIPVSASAHGGDASGHGHRSDSITSVHTTGRYEETVFHRHELDAVKRENETLKRKIRELERTLRARRQSDASQARSESVSTTASVDPRRDNTIGPAPTGIGRGREREKDGEDDNVRVGESAGNPGVHR